MKSPKTILCFSFIAVFILSCNKEKTILPLSNSSSDQKLVTDSIFIGAHYQGGVIYWIDETGQHGLIASEEDISNGIVWGYLYDSFTNAKGRYIGTGKINTRKILNTEGKDKPTAARKCVRYEKDGYSDWFLPSIYELYELYKKKDLFNNLSGYYWSSSESETNVVWFIDFNDLGIFGGPKSNVLKVRAVREF